MSNLGEGVFIRLAAGEAEKLYGYLKDTGHSENADGVKAFLFEAIDDEGGVLGKRILAYVERNPEAISLILGRAGGFARMAAGFFSKKKTPA